MAKIYFNRPIIKHLEETTVINFFFQHDEGDAIYVRDTRPDIYRDNKVVFGDILLYEKKDEPGSWNCDIIPMETPSYDIYGFYTGEGVDFEITAPAQPVFMIRQQETKLSLATVGYMPQTTDEVNEVALGLFHLGTRIKYRRDGVQIIDELTKKGWIRRMGPDDHKFGIITVEEAFQEKLKREEMLKDPVKAKEFLDEEKQRIIDAKNRKDIPEELANSLIRYKEDNDPNMIYYFLASDVKELVKKGIIL
jgi:DNA-binding transcriptional regulator YhcF (GntR family)